MIVIRPRAGLANRLRVLDSALSLARRLNTHVEVIWLRNPRMGARFRDLCEPVPGLSFRHIGKFAFAISSFQQNPLKRLISQLLHRAFGVQISTKEKDRPELYWHEENNVKHVDATKGDLYIHTCHDFYPSTTNFSWVQPIPIIRKKIDKATADFDEHTIGVHIRRTDHIHSIRESPIEEFIREMDASLQKDPQTKFFVATDDMESERFLANKYPGKIMYYSKVFGRDSVAGIQDALVDMFALSKTKLILASYESSFSQIAAKLGNVSMKVVRRSNN